MSMTMSNAAATSVAMPDETREAAAVVEAFLVASMVPDPQTAARYIADDLKITFTGGRKYGHPRETAAFNAKRYKWVKKKMERTDVVPGRGETIVYNLGTLYGEWPDGTALKATATSTASSCVAARSCRWTSGTTAPNGS
jgi:hypothetical protein